MLQLALCGHGPVATVSWSPPGTPLGHHNTYTEDIRFHSSPWRHPARQAPEATADPHSFRTPQTGKSACSGWHTSREGTWVVGYCTAESAGRLLAEGGTWVGAALGDAEQQAQRVELARGTHEREEQRHRAPHHQDAAQEGGRANPASRLGLRLA